MIFWDNGLRKECVWGGGEGGGANTYSGEMDVQLPHFNPDTALFKIHQITRQ